MLRVFDGRPLAAMETFEERGALQHDSREARGAAVVKMLADDARI